ncbi:MAG: ABC transporter ATP-binding protein [Dehalococcoidia bacterium]|nr:ABC transporter ATP-binding protein [Dehalococcoidia bacterium]MCA9826050.1 ABC transporter ATP-binding protein [Dehalococcoidia bacterium]MCA9845997.1 ABC transporter ATP-binding protein [Dehalococcoidia bacterium]MCA9855454.1 ABC transporter ATP-binding protein [Dehalococcoidia bacterium]
MQKTRQYGDVEPAILIENLTRSYGTTLAVDHLDLSVRRGEIFGFLGPNGAGKSTTIRVLLDLIRPDTGRAAIMGYDCQAQSVEARRHCGYLAGEFRSWNGLTGHETVELLASMRGVEANSPEVQGYAERLRLDLGRKAGEYSKGNRQKLGFLLALLGTPPVLLLDEPTSGLDPILQHEAHAILREQADRGVTVFFSSHVMSEVDQVCERVAIMRHGRLVTVDEIDDLKTKGIRHITVHFAEAAPPPGEFAGDGVRELSRNPASIEFEVQGEVDALLKSVARHHVVDIESSQPSLDDILLSFYEDAR